MALINCSECGKEISNKAKNCPNCGNPINQLAEQNKDTDYELLEFPELSENLEIGKQITNWTGDSAFDGHYNQSENTIMEIPTGKVQIILHTHGIEISQGLINFIPIHHSQIISIKNTSKEEISKSNKNIIGRAVVGGLILGPVGAVIGGMTGMGKEKIINKHYLVVNYWEVKSKSAKTLLISGSDDLIWGFLRRYKKEEKINKTENRIAEKEGIDGTIIFLYMCVILTIISVIYLIF
ncbi:zinc ribbon domain-containing protein [Tenacibaculum finnmarkense]|uniref:zinc ribbon domain-containing protein n=1 Tax=Tenacibaculum finnmarkense TaxID=2781243 RepID=UPI00187B695F|nr:zinc ribbon domain-containing protein [Tenacibaculum finnmarkense]MBE7645961.1 hypothetical protein [Tenacibaculum finnmarkense genomovar ulcerans]MCD8410309.1 zinc ribbon domain-containing protein [Tenacibaculum finnmarkense genomovar ulcerans]MCG8785599.1 hypothetical protein [Tenacibaculum finnmarkense]